MSADAASLASLSLTHVYYNPHDPISYLCAWLALMPQALCVVYATLVWSTREAEVALAFAGQLGCEAVNFALKRLIKEERPRHRHSGLFGLSFGGGGGDADESAAAGAISESDLHHLPFRRGYGMPSSHAQFAGYWAVTIALFLLVRFRSRQTVSRASDVAGSRAARTHPIAALSQTERVVASALVFFVACLIAWSRVYLHYHTPKQVAAGFAAGLTVGIGWFVATGLVRRWGLLDWALSLPPSRWLRLRDLAIEEDVLQAGWEKWQERQAAREAAKTK